MKIELLEALGDIILRGLTIGAFVLFVGWLIMISWGMVASIFEGSRTISFWPSVVLGTILLLLRSIVFYNSEKS